jgi:hypothetical protein
MSFSVMGWVPALLYKKNALHVTQEVTIHCNFAVLFVISYSFWLHDLDCLGT